MYGKQELELYECVSEFQEALYYFSLADLSRLARTSKAFSRLSPATLAKKSNKNLPLLNQAVIAKDIHLRLSLVLDYFDFTKNHQGCCMKFCPCTYINNPVGKFQTLKDLQLYLKEQFAGFSKYPLIGHKEKLAEGDRVSYKDTSLIIDYLKQFNSTLRELYNHELGLNLEKAKPAKIGFSIGLALAIFFPTTPMALFLTLFLVSLGFIYLTEHFNARIINYEYQSMINPIDKLIFEQETLFATPEIINRNSKRLEIIKLFREDKFQDSQNTAILFIRKQLAENPNISATALFDLIKNEITKPKPPERLFNRFFSKPKDEGDSQDLVNLFKRQGFDLQREQCQEELIVCLEQWRGSCPWPDVVFLG